MSTVNKINVGGTNYDIQDTTYTASSPLSIDASNVISIATGTGDDQVALGNHTHSGYAASSHTHTTSEITNFPTLAAVATSGSYNDLSNKPTIPVVDSALSTTSTNPVQNKVIYSALGNKADTSSLAAVATSGSYNDLSNKPTIPPAYSLPAATASVLGGVTIGDNISVSSGKISVGTASTSSFGVVKIGSGININNGVISVSGGGGGGGTEYTSGDGIYIDPSSYTVSINYYSSHFSIGTNGELLLVNGEPGTKIDNDGYYNYWIQSTNNLNTSYPGNSRGNGAVDLQQYRDSNDQVASGNFSVAMGSNNTASGYYSVATGYYNTVRGDYSVATGYYNTVSGYYSVAMGSNNISSGYYSVVMGGNNISSGDYSVATGYYNTVSGYYSVAMGSNNTASGDYSVALGAYNTIEKNSNYSLITGNNNIVNAENAIATGRENNATIPNSVSSNYSPYFGFNEDYPDNKYGNCGFFGLRVDPGRHEDTALFKLDFDSILIARIDVIVHDNSASFSDAPPIVSFNIIVTDCLITKNVNISTGSTTNVGLIRFYVVNNTLYVAFDGILSRRSIQIGVFYTLYTAMTQGGGNSSGSSSGSSAY